MAKPKHGRRNIICTSTQSSLDARTTSHLIPSHAVLSALAVIAASSPVAGSPIPDPTPPPAFLCPSIHRLYPVVSSPLPIARRDPTPSSSTTPPSPATTSGRPLVADKYVQGTDSLWRKTDQWTLYGSTCCSGSTSSSSHPHSHTSSSQTPMPTSAFTSAEFDTSVLPAGWDSAAQLSSSTESTIILALAIALAGSICVFILVCLLWRRRKKKRRDPELRLPDKLDTRDPKDNGQDTEAYGKMRTWTRATARWRSNIRQSARRRRKRPTTTVASIASRSLSPILSSETDPPPTPKSASTPTLSLDPTLSDPPTIRRERPRSASPPTYGAALAPSSAHLPLSAVCSLPSISSSNGSGPVQTGNQPSSTEDEPIPYVPPSDGHVATDDKAQLARIRELASSPTMVDAVGASALEPVSAPEWHEVEDDLDDLSIDLNQVPLSSPHFSFPPSFPPPPSMSDVPFGHLHGPPLRYGNIDDVLGTHSASTPSQPLPEVSPSAPSIDDLGLEPSAPPLEGEGGIFQDWEEASLNIPGTPISANLGSSSSFAEESTTVPFTSRASSSSIQESVARDDILPRYHP